MQQKVVIDSKENATLIFECYVNEQKKRIQKEREKKEHYLLS
jgi:hypothetical protein